MMIWQWEKVVSAFLDLLTQFRFAHARAVKAKQTAEDVMTWRCAKW
jgi:hypothetical protein